MEWIIVTGDSGGLGSAIARKILVSGMYGVIGISRSENNIVKDLYKNQIKPIGAIYGLVNNSAMAYDDIVTNTNEHRLTMMFNVNVLSAIMLTKYAIRDMLLHNIKGSIVHIFSVSAHTGYKGLSMYASTKGAMEAFSKNIAREWGIKGIRSNCVSPGFMETNISSKLTDEQRGKIYQRTSLKAATDIDSVAVAVHFLLSQESNSITEIVINIDNGTV